MADVRSQPTNDGLYQAYYTDFLGRRQYLITATTSKEALKAARAGDVVLGADCVSDVYRQAVGAEHDTAQPPTNEEVAPYPKMAPRVGFEPRIGHLHHRTILRHKRDSFGLSLDIPTSCKMLKMETLDRNRTPLDISQALLDIAREYQESTRLPTTWPRWSPPGPIYPRRKRCRS
jgi:hypothetical protein